MTRSFSAFVAQTPNPEPVRDNAVQQFGDGCEVATPRQDVPNRVRVECSGIPDFRSKIDTLGPVDWAVAMEESDVPGHHDRVEVFDGAEWIDVLVGSGFSGDTVEAYLERFHGILVDSAGPYLNSWQFDPSLALAAENPEETLAESPPKPPFEVTCDDYWVVAEADTNDPVQFEETFVDELVNTECVHERSATSAHDWATDDPITVEFVEPTTDSADRVRARVPLAFGGLYNRSGAGVDIDLRIDLETFGESLNWICFFLWKCRDGTGHCVAVCGPTASDLGGGSRFGHRSEGAKWR
jgi:hypothetical protein